MFKGPYSMLHIESNDIDDYDDKGTDLAVVVVDC